MYSAKGNEELTTVFYSGFCKKKFFLMSNKIKILQMILNSIFKILDKVQSTGIKR